MYSMRSSKFSGFQGFQGIIEITDLEECEFESTSNYYVYDKQYRQENYYMILIKDIKERELLSFVNYVQTDNIINSEYQSKIVYFCRNMKKNKISFLIKRDVDDIFLKDKLENSTLQEKVIFSLKLVQFLMKFEEYSKSTLRNNNYSFLYMTLDNIVFNTKSGEFKLLFYGFEIAKLKAGLQIKEEKTRCISYLPVECLEKFYTELDKSMINSYITGCILIEIFTNQQPWGKENEIEAKIKERLNLADYEVTKQNLKDELNLENLDLRQIDGKIILKKIVEILEVCCHSDYKSRKQIHEIYQLMKENFSYFQQSYCEDCKSEIKWIPNYIDSNEWKYICEFCKIKEDSPEYKLESVDNFFNQLRNDINATEQDFKKLLDYDNENFKKKCDKMYQELKKNLNFATEKINLLIDKLNLIKKELVEKYVKNFEEFFKELLGLNVKVKDFQNQFTYNYLDEIKILQQETLIYDENYPVAKEHYYKLKSYNSNHKELKNNMNVAFSKLNEYYESIVYHENKATKLLLKKIEKDLDETYNFEFSPILYDESLSLKNFELKKKKDFNEFNQVLKRNIIMLINPDHDYKYQVFDDIIKEKTPRKGNKG